MFNKKNSTNTFDVIIGKNTTFNGNVEAKGNVKIDGTVEGDIETNGKVFTGEESLINGNIISNGIVISGTVEGNIKSIGELEITDTGELTGDILVTSFSIANGGTFKGNCSINTEDSNKKIESLKKDFFDIDEKPIADTE